MDIKRGIQAFTERPVETLLLLPRAWLAGQDVELNKVVAARAAFIVAVEHALAGGQGFKHLKTIVRWHGKLRDQALLQDVGNLRELTVGVALAQDNAGERHEVLLLFQAAERGNRRRPAGVKRQMGKDFGYLLLAKPVLLRKVDMPGQLLHAAQCGEGCKRNQAALTRGKNLPFPDIIKQDLLAQFGQFGCYAGQGVAIEGFCHRVLSVLTVSRFWRDSFVLKIKLFAINHPEFQDDMDKLPLTLDLDALRSFVTGIESGSFAQAATRLCRSTSAVSAQLKKLEMQCGAALVVKRGRHLELTHSGEILIGYARRLLALNDEAQRALQGELLQGEIRIGMQEDFGESLMPGILGAFRRHHPGLRIIARVDRNQALLSALDASALDMALYWQPDNHPVEGKLLGQCRMEWIKHPDLDIATLLTQGEPLPLVMFDSPCLMRKRATACLDRAGITWQVVFVSQPERYLGGGAGRAGHYPANADGDAAKPARGKR